MSDWPEFSCFAQLAIHFAKMGPHAAGIERIWSVMDGIHTKSRNSLSIEKVTAATTAKLQIQRERCNAAEMREQTKKRLAMKTELLVAIPVSETDVHVDVVEISASFESGEMMRLEEFDENQNPRIYL